MEKLPVVRGCAMGLGDANCPEAQSLGNAPEREALSDQTQAARCWRPRPHFLDSPQLRLVVAAKLDAVYPFPPALSGLFLAGRRCLAPAPNDSGTNDVVQSRKRSPQVSVSLAVE